MSRTEFRIWMWMSFALAIVVALFWSTALDFLLHLEKRAGMSYVSILMNMPLLMGGMALPPAALAAYAIWRRCLASGQSAWWAGYGLLAGWTATSALFAPGFMIAQRLFFHGHAVGRFGHVMSSSFPFGITILGFTVLIALLPVIATLYVFSGDYERVLYPGESLREITGPGNIPSGRYFTSAVMAQSTLVILSLAGNLLYFAIFRLSFYFMIRGDILFLIKFYLSIAYFFMSLLSMVATAVTGFLLGAAIRRQTPGNEQPSATPPSAPPPVDFQAFPPPAQSTPVFGKRV